SHDQDADGQHDGNAPGAPCHASLLCSMVLNASPGIERRSALSTIATADAGHEFPSPLERHDSPMPLVPFRELMQDAERGNYGVGFVEGWTWESLRAVAAAAEGRRSRVILGFSGVSLPHPERRVADPLGVYAAMGSEVGRRLTVPCCLLFNESPHRDWVLEAIRLGFQLVMYTPEDTGFAGRVRGVREVVEQAHAQGVAVEGEVAALVGVGGELTEEPAERRLTDPQAARRFVEETGVDALAVNVGQVHLHGRRAVTLDLERLRAIRQAV